MIGFLKLTPLILAAAAAAKYDARPNTSNSVNRPRAEDGVTLNWLDGSPPPTTPVGSTFGVPWSQGELNKTASELTRLSYSEVVPESHRFNRHFGAHSVWKEPRRTNLAACLVRPLL
jgi:hypothetical protein